jgi:hypothetical protein
MVATIFILMVGTVIDITHESVFPINEVTTEHMQEINTEEDKSDQGYIFIMNKFAGLLLKVAKPWSCFDFSYVWHG